MSYFKFSLKTVLFIIVSFNLQAQEKNTAVIPETKSEMPKPGAAPAAKSRVIVDKDGDQIIIIDSEIRKRLPKDKTNSATTIPQL
jgi:hypothetical protein